MNSLSIKKMLATALAGLYLSILAGAQTMSDHYQMAPKVEQAIDKMRTTQSNVEVLQALTAIQDRTEQATQVILASMNVLDLEQRSKILIMLFQLPEAEDGLNASHIPLLVQLYIKTAQSPHLPFHLEQPRSFIKKEVLNLRLLIIIASLLHADSPLATLSPGESMPRLLRLLESVRGSSLSAADHKIVEDVIIVVKKGIEENEVKNITPTPSTSPSNTSMVQPAAPTRPPEHKPTPPPTSETSSVTSWSTIIVLVMVALGLFNWVFKRRSEKNARHFL